MTIANNSSLSKLAPPTLRWARGVRSFPVAIFGVLGLFLGATTELRSQAPRIPPAVLINSLDSLSRPGYLVLSTLPLCVAKRQSCGRVPVELSGFGKWTFGPDSSTRIRITDSVDRFRTALAELRCGADNPCMLAGIMGYRHVTPTTVVVEVDVEHRDSASAPLTHESTYEIDLQWVSEEWRVVGMRRIRVS